MHINVVYPKIIPFSYIKIKSKFFFHDANYKHRNNVYVNSNGDVVFALYRNRIHIYVPNDSVALQSIVALFLKKLFRNTLIGINGLNDTSLAIFSSLNYISI